MKINIYNSGYGWSFPIGNYRKKDEDPIWVNLKFIDGYTFEPIFDPDVNGKDHKKIFVNEGSFNKYVDDKGKLHLTMSIFNYDLLTDIELTENNVVDDSGKRFEPKLNDGSTDMFGGNIDVDLNPDDFPFY